MMECSSNPDMMKWFAKNLNRVTAQVDNKLLQQPRYGMVQLRCNQ